MMLPILALIAIAATLFIGLRYRMLKQMILMLCALLVVVAIVGFVKYKGFQGFMAMKEGMAHMKQTISSTRAVTSDWHSELEVVGSLRAEKGVDISNEIAGMVEEIDFNSGQDVKEGTLLLKLRAEDNVAQLATLQAAEKLAEINFNRDKKQLAAQAVSQASVDTDAATLAGARAQVDEQKAIIDKKFIRAPFTGHLGIRNVDLGQYLNSGTAIVTLQQMDPLYLDFNLPQQALAQVKVGQKIAVKNDTYPDRKFEGTIAAINPRVDITTRNVAIRAEIDNKDHALLPGMYATADISVGEEKSFITLPQTAITYNPYGNTVFIIRHADEMKPSSPDSGDVKKESEKAQTPNYKPVNEKDDDLVVEQSFVTVGETRGDQVQVLKGVNAGDLVVSAGQLKLQNGAGITINNTVVPKNDANPKPSEQ